MDLDIFKCYPSMLLQICKDAGILETPKLTQYTKEGKALISEILLSEEKEKEEEGHSVCSSLLIYEDVKKAFLVCLHCGDNKYNVV
jgi:hypothetical protein